MLQWESVPSDNRFSVSRAKVPVGMSLRVLKFSGGSVDDYAICRSSERDRDRAGGHAHEARRPASACQHIPSHGGSPSRLRGSRRRPSAASSARRATA